MNDKIENWTAEIRLSSQISCFYTETNYSSRRIIRLQFPYYFNNIKTDKNI